MNRIIKFRGLRTDGKGWVYGDLMQSNYTGCLIAIEHELPPTMEEPGGDITTIYHDVVDASVGQYMEVSIGGRAEVMADGAYEGDILVYKGRRYELKNHGWQWVLRPVDFGGDMVDIVVDEDVAYLSHIIGTIHEIQEA